MHLRCLNIQFNLRYVPSVLKFRFMQILVHYIHIKIFNMCYHISSQCYKRLVACDPAACGVFQTQDTFMFFFKFVLACGPCRYRGLPVVSPCGQFAQKVLYCSLSLGADSAHDTDRQQMPI